MLTFNEHINSLSRNASYKLYAFCRIRKYLTQDQAKVLYNVFNNSHFNYAPSIWMFYRKTQYLKIQKIHHKVLKVVFNSDNGYDELLQMSNEIIIHQKQLHALICEVFKSLNNSNPKFTWSYFTFKIITYNIRNGPILKLPNAKSTYYSINSVNFRACLLLNGIPHSIKHSEFILGLTRKLKELENVDYSCISCR